MLHTSNASNNRLMVPFFRRNEVEVCGKHLFKSSFPSQGTRRAFLAPPLPLSILLPFKREEARRFAHSQKVGPTPTGKAREDELNVCACYYAYCSSTSIVLLYWLFSTYYSNHFLSLFFLQKLDFCFCMTKFSSGRSWILAMTKLGRA